MTAAERFRKKPVVIEAIQWTGSNFTEIADWAGRRHNGPGDVQTTKDGVVGVLTREGFMRAEIGDWIIKGVKGEVYPCKPDVFAASYEAEEYTRPREGSEPKGAGYGKPWVAADLTYLAAGAYVRSLLTTEKPLVGVDLTGHWYGAEEEDPLSLVIHAEVARQMGEALIEAAHTSEQEVTDRSHRLR